MSRCPAYSRSCPEPVSTVNLNVTQIHLSDGNIDLFKQEPLTLALVEDDVYTADLSQLPYTDASLSVYINGVLQKPGRDYTRYLKTLTFTLSPLFDPAMATVMAVYVGTDYARLESAIQPGMIVGAAVAGNHNFIGFIRCDGALYTHSDYPGLFDVIGTVYNLPGDNAATHFRVPNIDSAYVDGTSNFNTGPAWIKV